MSEEELARRVAAVRRFNRFYTKQIGLLTDRYLKSPFSLTEARVVYELAHHEQTTATRLGAELGLDAGYLSRILRDFKKRGLVTSRTSPVDGRQSLLALTDKGQSAFASINASSAGDIGRSLSRLAPESQNRLVDAMGTIETLLGAQPEQMVPYILRPPQPGDMGWVVHSHGALYAQEYAWNQEFEALVAEIVAKFIRHYDARCERCWIAEREGANVGSVFLVKKSQTAAKLRLLLVAPQARGLGIGTRLVDECLRFAQQVGYKKIVLWTNSVLVAARHIYEKAGFELADQNPHHSFGHDLVGETWERTL